MRALLIYSLLSAALYYLGSRALITQAVWSRYPRRIARFMDCSACVGFWWGLILALTLGRDTGIDVGPFTALDPKTPILVGLCMITLNPVAAAVMQWGLDNLGAADVGDDFAQEDTQQEAIQITERFKLVPNDDDDISADRS